MYDNCVLFALLYFKSFLIHTSSCATIRRENPESYKKKNQLNTYDFLILLTIVGKVRLLVPCDTKFKLKENFPQLIICFLENL